MFITHLTLAREPESLPAASLHSPPLVECLNAVTEQQHTSKYVRLISYYLVSGADAGFEIISIVFRIIYICVREDRLDHCVSE